MKYISIDIETAGLDPNRDSLLQVSMIAVDSSKVNNLDDLKEAPHMTCSINHRDIIGNPYAIQMNAWILRQIAGVDEPKWPIITLPEFETKAHEFLNMFEPAGQKRHLAAGKNVANFDIPFLPRSVRERFMHRTIDPAMMYIDWSIDDKPPALTDCLKRAGLDNFVTHDAYDDALQVAQLIENARLFPLHEKKKGY